MRHLPIGVTLYPTGYGNKYVTLAELRRRHEPHMHPEFAERLFAWIEHMDGRVGIGGGYRPPGAQPDATGFAPPGSSFHEGQHFPSGRWYAAVDLVVIDGADADDWHDAPSWDLVPHQGSAEAARWGVHCNVGKPGDPYPKGESWHMQPVELDGHGTWVAAGRPDLRPNYPFPGRTQPSPDPSPIPVEVLMGARLPLVQPEGYANAYALLPVTQDLLSRLGILGQPAIPIKIDVLQLEAEQGYKLQRLKG